VILSLKKQFEFAEKFMKLENITSWKFLCTDMYNLHSLTLKELMEEIEVLKVYEKVIKEEQS